MSRRRNLSIASLTVAVLAPAYAMNLPSAQSAQNPSMSISDVSVSENERFVTLTVTRTAVKMWTSTNFDVRPGTASAKSDYIRTSGGFMFEPGETTKRFTIPIVADDVGEGSETFTAFIYGTNNVPILRGTATVTITDDAPALPRPSAQPLSGMTELAPIASNFNAQPLLEPSWGTGATPASASPDVVGAFRFICNPSHLAYDDPIVNPGRPGAAHLHQFFGNTRTNAHSTYDSLRTTGDSTCGNSLNRSGYWMPAMLNGRGQVVRPDFISIYYKRRPDTDPICSNPSNPQYMGKCAPLPRGLRYVFGYDMDKGIVEDGAKVSWSCQSVGRSYRSIPEASQACPVGGQIVATLHSPVCWDGRQLDSADHRSHMAYATYGSWGYLKCPITHPVLLPEFTMSVFYTTDATLDRSGNTGSTVNTWHLSSDRNHMGTPVRTPGTSFHSDWFGAWDDDIMNTWTTQCINRKLSCTGGDLGNGQQLKTFAGFRWNAEPRLVPVPVL